MPQTMIAYRGYFLTMNDISRKLRRKSALKKVTVSTIPEDLIKNPLIVRRIERKMTM